jgi:hypothetical protein
MAPAIQVTLPALCPRRERVDLTTIDHPATSLGLAVSDRGSPIRDYFQIAKSNLTRSSSQRLSGTKKAKGVSSRPHHVCYWGQLGSECLAAR